MPPSTRSASASISSPIARAVSAAASPSITPAKRARANDASTPKSAAKGKQSKIEAALPPAAAVIQEASSPTRPKFEIIDGIDDSAELVVRPELAFNLEEAKRHLRSVDSRFHSLFERLPCKPFEEETDLNPFRALCSSILGQQVRSLHFIHCRACYSQSSALDFLACS